MAGPNSKIVPSDMEGPVTQQLLDDLNRPQQRDTNKDTLADLGGVPALLAKMNVDPKVGLREEQRALHMENFGNNGLPEKPMKSFFQLFLESFEDVTLIILICAAVVSLIIGIFEDPAAGWIEGSAILIAVLIVAIVTATNDYTKEQQFRALEESSKKDHRSLVIRSGEVQNINPDDLTVGDVVQLKAGDGIPADGILIDDHVSIVSNESSLTGEPEPLTKSHARDPFLLSSCTVTEASQTVKMLVIGIGENSQWGKIRAKLQDDPVNTPLQDKLDDMAKLIGYIGTVAAAATFVALLVSHAVHPEEGNWVGAVIEAFIIAITIIVVAIPEGLPLAVTISLAYSTTKMYEDQNLIRVLAACETMGNATNICSDKTGTLTENRMTVVEGWFAGQHVHQDAFGYVHETLSEAIRTLVAENACVNRITTLIYKDELGQPLHRPIISGNATEGALLLMSKAWGSDEEELKASVFDDERGDKVFAFNSKKKRSSAVVHRADGSVRLYCKGAPEWVLDDCAQVNGPEGNPVPMTPQQREAIDQAIRAMADNALRTLCLAHRDFANPEQLPEDWSDNPPDSEGLIVDAVVGIIDPLRDDVKDAVRIAQEAGVIVRMVTGDNIHTARAIAKQCGILTEDGLAMEGPNFRTMTPRELDKILPRLQVLARSSPDDKYLLVTRLNGHGVPRDREEWEQKHPGHHWETERYQLLSGFYDEWEMIRPDGGQVVGVTGDGTNDAPALKAADVGLSMGITGTQVAKDASDIVILDDKFSSIVRAIKWGRSVYDNIRKFLQFQLTVNVVALLLVFIGAVAGFDPPLNAVMMLWVNLIMDTMGALALGTEMPTDALLQRRPYKRTASLISWPMWRNILTQSVFQLILLLIILFAGKDLFNLTFQGNWCTKWDWGDKDGKVELKDGTKITCKQVPEDGKEFLQDFTDIAKDGKYEIIDTCDGLCTSWNYRHFTILFNAFVFCQVFNEFNARSIFHDVNVFKGLINNPIFMGVVVTTILMQLFIVEVGGDFTRTEPLPVAEWFITIALGAIAIPVGMLMRFIPMEEDPNTFNNSSKVTTLADGEGGDNGDVESLMAAEDSGGELVEAKKDSSL